jgi:hypothetical protein
VVVSVRRLAVAVCILAAVSVQADTQTPFSIDAYIISAGSSVRARSSCFGLTATIAEPVAGFSSSTNFALSGGFLAHVAANPSDDIFFNGFEECPP